MTSTKATIACEKKKEAGRQAGFPFVCACGLNTRLNFQIEIRQNERGIAESYLLLSNHVVVISLDG